MCLYRTPRLVHHQSRQPVLFCQDARYVRTSGGGANSRARGGVCCPRDARGGWCCSTHRILRHCSLLAAWQCVVAGACAGNNRADTARCVTTVYREPYIRSAGRAGAAIAHSPATCGFPGHVVFRVPFFHYVRGGPDRTGYTGASCTLSCPAQQSSRSTSSTAPWYVFPASLYFLNYSLTLVNASG